jgi:hypothetical protein
MADVVDMSAGDDISYDIDMKELQRGEAAQVYGNPEAIEKYGYVARK